MMKPLTDMNEFLLYYWPEMVPGFLKVMQHSNGDMDLHRVMKEIMSGELLCWVVPAPASARGRAIDGFVTTKIEIVDTSPQKKWLQINHTWCHPNVQPLTHTAPVHKFLEGYAKELGCERITVLSLLDIARWMGEFGFKPGYIEYFKEVPR